VLVTRWSGDVLDLPQVSLKWVLIGSIQFIMRSVFKLNTDLIINWIDPIKTHSSETWGKSCDVYSRYTHIAQYAVNSEKRAFVLHLWLGWLGCIVLPALLYLSRLICFINYARIYARMACNMYAPRTYFYVILCLSTPRESHAQLTTWLVNYPQGLRNRRTDVRLYCTLKLAWRTPRISGKYDRVHFLQQSWIVTPFCLP
jgi:hypothetical protein